MVKLSKMKTVKRIALLSSCITAVVAGVFCATKFTKSDETKAITAAGSPLKITYNTVGTETEPAALKGWVTFRRGWGTPMFIVQPNPSSSNDTFTAFCLDPNVIAPTEGEKYTAGSKDYNYMTIAKESSDVNNKIKLAIYLATAPSTDVAAQSILNEWFPESGITADWQSIVTNGTDQTYGMRNYRYVMFHALAGYINNHDKADTDPKKAQLNAAWENLAEAERTWITSKTEELGTMISGDSQVWQTAKKYKLYGLDLSEIEADNVLLQDIAWIEQVPYSLDTYAVDGLDEDKYVEGAKNAKIIDHIDYCGEKGSRYTIIGSVMDKSTHSILKINGEEVTASVTVTPTADSGCGATEMSFNFDASGLGGKDLVVFESLYSGDDLLAEHKNWNDSLQSVSVIFLDTDASDKSDKDKEVYAAKDAVITDNIKYCLPTGTEYTFVGVLMNKEKGEPLFVNDKIVSNTATVTPTENCGELNMGELNMDFEFDATGLSGTEIVAFEYAGIKTDTQLSDDDICISYNADESAEDGATCSAYLHTIISHQNLNDAAQTVLVTDPPKTPETGTISSEKGSSDGANKMIMTIAIATSAICVVAYLAHRFMSKKRFLGRR